MSSPDFKAFIQAEAEECARLAGSYQGADVANSGPVEHLTTGGLEELLTAEIPVELRMMYLQEYDEIRAAMRAVAMVQMTRKDCYDNASQVVLKDRAFLADSLAFNSYNQLLMLEDITDTERAEFDAREAEMETKKSQVRDRLQTEGKSTTSDIDDSDVIRKAMTGVSGVNSRGVSTGIKEIS